jgi:DNA-binding MarR family transcriptional regulator
VADKFNSALLPQAARARLSEGLDNVADRPQLDLANYLPYLINRVGVAMVASFTENALVAHDLSIDMWRVLAALSHGGVQRQVDLVSRTSIDASTMSRLVTRLVRMGLVVRARSKTSSREVVVTLSPMGSALVARIFPIAYQLEQTAIAGLPAKDLGVVKRALRHFYDNLVKARPTR